MQVKTSHYNRKCFCYKFKFAGIRFTADISKPEGSRVIDLKIRCQRCAIPKYEPYNPNATYRVALLSFLVGGGDGYKMIKENIKNVQIGELDTDVYEAYIKKMSPITQQTEGRITILNNNL